MRCPHCNEEAIWQSDGDLEEAYPELNQEGIVSWYYCGWCNHMLEGIFKIIDGKLIEEPSIILIKDRD